MKSSLFLTGVSAHDYSVYLRSITIPSVRFKYPGVMDCCVEKSSYRFCGTVGENSAKLVKYKYGKNILPPKLLISFSESGPDLSVNVRTHSSVMSTLLRIFAVVFFAATLLFALAAIAVIDIGALVAAAVSFGVGLFAFKTVSIAEKENFSEALALLECAR